MFGYFTLIILLQAFCLYHAYKNNAEQRWYWFIILLPAIGGLIYLFYNFYNRNSIQNLTEGVKVVVNSNYRIEQLEKAMAHSDNFSNKINLADAYVGHERYGDAVVLYLDCLQGFMADDASLRMKLLQAYFLNQDYESAILYGNLLESEKAFKNSEERLAYAWALHHRGKTELAETIFKDMDKSFSNYRHRFEYCKFLISTDKKEAFKNTLNDLLEEFEYMKSPERSLHRNIIREIEDLNANQIGT